MEIREIVMKYIVLMPRRFYKNEKLRYLHSIKEDAEKVGLRVSLQKDKKKFSSSVNLIVGDLERASVVFVTHYDTPAKDFIKTNSHPFKQGLEPFIKMLNEGIPLLIGSTISFLGFYMINSNVKSLPLSLGLYLAISLFLVAGTVRFSKGFPEKYNLQCNSAAIAIVVSLFDKISSSDVAFAFTDNEKVNHHGDLMLKPKISNKQIIHMSYLGAGEVLLLTSLPENMRLRKKVAKHFKNMKVSEMDLTPESIDHHSIKSYPSSVSIALSQKEIEEQVISNGKKAMQELSIEKMENMVNSLSDFIENVTA